MVQKIIQKKQFELEAGLLIFGEPRSGTTWLMELLMTNPAFCINWEPLHVKKGLLDESINFGWHPFLKSEDFKKHKQIFFEMLNCQSFNDWTIQFNSIQRARKSRYVLTKFVRANLLIPQLTSNFNFSNKPLFLLRHPIDTCVSQLKAFEPKLKAMKEIKIPSCLNNERFVEHHEYLKTLSTNLEIKIAYWCMNNVPTINDSQAMSKLEVIYYEDLLLDPRSQMAALISKLNYELDVEDMLRKMKFEKRSQTDFNHEYKVDRTKQLVKNISELSESELNQIQKIFDHFEFEVYKAEDPMPFKRV